MINLLLVGGVSSLISPWLPLLFIGASILNNLSMPLTEMTTLVVGFFSILFAMEYIKEKRKEFSLFLSFFVAAMILFLKANDWITIYMAWEFMGLCSYLLIALKSTALCRKAARRVFIINRISGVAFLLAIVIINATTGSFNLGLVPSGAALLLLIAVMVKSSQFPFFWLQDAMEAPTPVSALLHSATMVAAGPILLNRFSESFSFLTPIIIVWALTSIVIASIFALVENHQKKVLAYSTISTIAFLFIIFNSPYFAAAFAVHALLKAAYFFLIGTYASGVKYAIEMGLNRRSLSSVLSLFLLLSLSGFPFMGLFWFKIGESLAPLTVFFSMAYFLKMYLTTFSGGIKPKRGSGTYIALILATSSIILYPLAFPDLWFVLFTIIASALAFFALKTPYIYFVENLVNFLNLVRLPEVEPPEEWVENWGYYAGVAVRHLSKRINEIFTGPVGRDVSYIALSIVALVLGVIMC
ncbi:MAG: hypothetical protein GOV01_00645 [Candidatus Altiarchaeota archaeon]|nr:hypothetical protein [Candidatus Altiarchaeota archaeon]